MIARDRLTYANVMATAAVFIALGGGAYAALRIDSEDIKRGAVTSRKLAQKAVTHGRVADDAIGSANLRADAVGLPVAGATINRQGKLVGWFNRLGDGPPNIIVNDSAVYDLAFPGLENLGGILDSSVVHSATASGETSGVLGDPGYATVRMSGPCSGFCVDHPVVTTFDKDGNRAELGFSYVMFLGESILSAGRR